MNISSVRNCYGCMACHDICPRQCIEIKKGKLGHLYPYINEEDCIDCELCIKRCQCESLPKLNAPKRVLASWSKDNQEREQSSSGGLASVIANFFIQQKGVVYGCAFKPPFSFSHIRCTKPEELNALKGSKYVQSNTIDIYKQISCDLKAKRKILLIGTPCQIAAAKNLFNNEDNLYTIDLVCHGVPSEDILKNSLPKGLDLQGVNQVEFRMNTKFQFSIKNDTSTIFSRPLKKDYYLKGFFTGLYYRDSCYACRYAQKSRIGDITLGDFWGVKLDNIEIDLEKGISLCMVNTTAGENMMAQISDRIVLKERLIEEAIVTNKQLSHPTRRTFRAKLFMFLYPKIGFKYSVACSIPEVILKNLILG